MSELVERTGSLAGAESTLRRLTFDLAERLDRTGIMFRIFGRPKSIRSIDNKIDKKNYVRSQKLLQDLIGIRVVVYFPDDCAVVQHVAERTFSVDGHSIDDPQADEFGPRRLNIVLRVPPNLWNIVVDSRPIDQTFELQIRTVFSEGWHEVEHDLRYRCFDDWQVDKTCGRALNGALASLETAEWTMGSIFDRLAYRHYRARNWESMLRHKFRMRIQERPLSDSIINLLNSNSPLAKRLWRTERRNFLAGVVERNLGLPWTYDNLVFVAAALAGIDSPELDAIAPPIVKEVISGDPD